jgi:hypothetical protein
MSDGQARSISIGELEKAVTAAVQQVQQQKKLAAIKMPIILGIWFKDFVPAEAQVVASGITKEVVRQLPGLQAKPFHQSQPGGTTIGFILEEESLLSGYRSVAAV